MPGCCPDCKGYADLTKINFPDIPSEILCEDCGWRGYFDDLDWVDSDASSD